MSEMFTISWSEILDERMNGAGIFLCRILGLDVSKIRRTGFILEGSTLRYETLTGTYDENDAAITTPHEMPVPPDIADAYRNALHIIKNPW